MYKRFLKYPQVILALIFIIYLVYTLNNAIEVGFEVVLATFLCLILYIQSVGQFLFFLKTKGRPRLIDWMRLVLFYSIVLDFMKMVNFSKGRRNLLFIDNFTTDLTEAPYVLGVLMIAFASLDLGYFVYKIVNIKKTNDIKKVFHFKIVRKNVLLGLFLITTIIKMYLLFSEQSGYGSSIEYTNGINSFINSIQNAFNQFAIIMMGYVFFIQNYKKARFRNIYIILIGVQIVIGLLSGMKEDFLTPIIFTLIIYLIAGGNVKKKYVLISIICLLVLYPLINLYRNVINDSFLNNGNHLYNISIAMNNLFDQPIMETITSSSDSYGNRFSMYSYFHNSIEMENNWSYYKYMNRYAVLPLVWIIPRKIWPTKPRNDVGAKYNEKLVGRTTNSITPMNVGWVYLEGGLVFVIIVFSLIGLTFSKIESFGLKTPLILLLYLWCFSKAIKPELDPYFLFSELIQFLVLTWFLLKFLGLKKYKIILTLRDE